MSASKKTPQKNVRIKQGKPVVDETAVPKQNVLDLRSVIAKQEAKAAPEPATPTKKKKPAKAKKTARVKKPKKKAPKPKPVKTKTPKKAAKKKKTTRKTTRQLSAAATKKLPKYGFSVGTVVWPLVAFVTIGLAIVLPVSASRVIKPLEAVQASIVANSEQAFDQIQVAAAATQTGDFAAAQTAFQRSQQYFAAAQDTVNSIHPGIKLVAPLVPGKGKQFVAGKRLLTAGNAVATAGESTAEALALLNGTDLAAAAKDESVGLTQALVVLRAALGPASEQVTIAGEQLEKVKLDDIPADKRELLGLAKELMPAIEAQVTDSVDLVDTVLQILGHDAPKRYLLVFQNPYEQRPTGGFIGSLAQVDISRGVLEEFTAPGGGVYDISGQFDQKLISPSPLHLVNAHWNLQDANWFPHVPASAEKIQWFYENSGQASVDGVIFLTPKVVEDLLAITGPVQLDEEFENQEITAENFYVTVQTVAEQKFDENPQSKRIIGALLPLVLDKVFASTKDPDSLVSLLQLFQNSLDRKEIMLSVNDPDLEAQLEARNWNGALATTERDYLHVNVSNIGGHKASGAAEKTIRHTAQVNNDGTIDVTVEVSSVHTGDSSNDLENTNIPEFIRFYVPEGSQLTSVSGFEEPDPASFFRPDVDATVDADLVRYSGDITVNDATGIYTNTEFGHTVFGGWTITRLGASSDVSMTYRLPFKMELNGWLQQTDHYSLLVQKQPGSFDDVFIHQLQLPNDVSMLQTTPSDYAGSVTDILDTDMFFGAVLRH